MAHPTERRSLLYVYDSVTDAWIPAKGDADGNLYMELESADIQIGAVEVKNATTDDRLTVTANGDAQVTLDSEVVAVDATGQGDVPVTLDSEAVVLGAGTANIGKVDVPTATPTVYNVTLTSADTEYSQAMPANCRGFEFQARTSAAVRFAFVTGKVATPTAPYMTLKAGDYYFTPTINQGASPSTLYLASSVAGTVAEIIAWV